MAEYVMSKLVQNENTDGPFEKLGITDEDFVMLDTLKDKTITIVGYKNYVKDESDGVFVAFECDGKLSYTATHAVGIVKAFQNPEVQRILDEEGKAISATVVQRKSKKTGRMYFCFE